MKTYKPKVKFIAVFSALAILLSLAVMPASAAEAKAADLTVTGISSVSNELYDGDKIAITATVRNSSNVDVEGKISVDFAIDGQFLQTVTYNNGLKAGKVTAVTTTFTYFLFGGSHRVTAYVNAGKRVSEINYNNNVLKERIDVSMDENSNPESNLPIEFDPVAVTSPIVIQAEKASVNSSSKIQKEIEGYKGSGYVTVFSGNDGFTVTFTAPEEGKYTMNLRNSTYTREKARLSYSVNGAKAAVAALRAQNRVGSWADFTAKVTLKKGTNTVKFFLDTEDYGNALIDQVKFIKDSDGKVSSFRFLKADNPSLPGDINCDIEASNITAYIPGDVDVTDLVATYKTNYSTVKVQGAVQKSGVTHNDFTNGHYYTFSDGSGNSRTYAVKFTRLSGKNVPSMHVNFGPDVSSDDIKTLTSSTARVDKELVVNCSYTLTSNGSYGLPYSKNDAMDEINDVSGTVKLRGNSTLNHAKKSYKVKFDKKQTLLDMEKSKSWVLLGCFADKSLLRDYTGYLIGQSLTNMGYSPDMRFVHLFFDGKYKGLYLLGEGAKIGKGRLDMTEITSESTDITGGYILELDSRRDEAENVMFEVTLGDKTCPFTIKEPDEDVVDGKIRNYIKGYLQETMDAILQAPNNNNYEKYIDVDSFVDWYIGMEIAKVRDSTGLASIYLHKDAGGKLCMGPMWDFVPGFGADEYGQSLADDGSIIPGSVASPNGYWIKNTLWWKYLFKNKSFVQKVEARWQELYATGFNSICDKVEDAHKYIKSAAGDNFKRWDILDRYEWDQPIMFHSYEAYVKDYENWLAARIEWLNTQYGK